MNTHTAPHTSPHLPHQQLSAQLCAARCSRSPHVRGCTPCRDRSVSVRASTTGGSTCQRDAGSDGGGQGGVQDVTDARGRGGGGGGKGRWCGMDVEGMRGD